MNIDNRRHYQLLSDSFQVQFEEEEFADCSLVAEGKSVKVHKAILCSNSSFLQKIISDHNDSELTLVIDGICFDDLYLVIQFLYKGDVAVSCDQVGSFLVVADLLGMKWIDDVSLSHQEIPSFPSKAKASKLPLSILPSKSSAPFKNVTNTLTGKIRKRKKHERNKESFKKMRIVEMSKDIRARYHQSTPLKNNPETDLAKMDENTFCITLGLKKNEARDFIKCNMSNSSRKIIPPRSKIDTDVKLKFLENANVPESANLPCETRPVFIEAKNLSFLNIDANELYIRENNIEIECDVLNVTPHELMCKKGDHITAGNILQFDEGNLNAQVMTDAENDSFNVDTNETTSDFHKNSKRGSTFMTKGAYPYNEGKDDVRQAVSSGHDPTIFWCDVCQRTYHTKTGLNQHKRYECCKDPAFACPRCEKCFKRKSSLVRHAITLHNEAVYPTRTKLLSKLTSPRTIAGKR